MTVEDQGSVALIDNEKNTIHAKICKNWQNTENKSEDGDEKEALRTPQKSTQSPNGDALNVT